MNADSTGTAALLRSYKERLQTTLNRVLPPATQYPARLHEAMRYACEGGKHLRAQLVYAGGGALKLPPEQLDAPAAAVELIHTYSLVHDDLPAMDDDDLRRGRPTVHKAYDEATAILVGDGLQALAFDTLSRAQHEAVPADAQLRMLRDLAAAAGSRGMVGGQAVDLASEGQSLTLAELEALHIHKTGALIRACLQMACAAAVQTADPSRCEALDHFAKCIGLAFQIQDDLLDIESSADVLGKSIGKDEASGKSTYPAIMGLPAARERAESLFIQAREHLAPFGDDAAALLALTDLIQFRDR